jgi:hypothetical protein
MPLDGVAIPAWRVANKAIGLCVLVVLVATGLAAFYYIVSLPELRSAQAAQTTAAAALAQEVATVNAAQSKCTAAAAAVQQAQDALDKVASFGAPKLTGGSTYTTQLPGGWTAVFPSPQDAATGNTLGPQIRAPGGAAVLDYGSQAWAAGMFTVPALTLTRGQSWFQVKDPTDGVVRSFNCDPAATPTLTYD